jgi:predicted aspartyl protease
VAQRALPVPNAKGNQATAATPAISWHTAGEIVLPFEYFRQHIYVTASINGKPGFIFMLDSGANRNILNLRSALQLGIKPRMAQEKDIGFGEGRTYVGPEESVDVAIGSILVAHGMSVMDLNKFEQHFHHPTDGLLGYPFFRQFVVKIDFQRKLLTLLSANAFSYHGLGIKIPLRPSKNFAVMPVTVGSAKYTHHPINVVVDTGSNVTLALYERFVHSLDLASSLSHAQSGEAYGLNGYYPVALGTIDSFQIGSAETHNLAVNYMRNDDQVGSERNIPGAIGNGILQSFQVVIFDVPHRRMIFELKPPPWQPGVERTETIEP